MNRKDFQELADVRERESEALLDLKLYDGAFYLAAYATECAPKACIAKTISMHEYPPTKDHSSKLFTHSIEALVGLAGLKEERKTDSDADQDLASNWNIVILWSETGRDQRWTRGHSFQRPAARLC